MERAKAVTPKHEVRRWAFLCRDRLRLGKPFSSGIGVDRHTPVFQTGIQGAQPSCSTKFRDANTGAGQGFTDLAAVVDSTFASRSLRMATRVANLDSKVPALNRQEVLAHGHQVRLRGNPPFQNHGEMMMILRFARSCHLRFGGVRKRSSRPAREMPAMGRRTIRYRRSNESGRR